MNSFILVSKNSKDQDLYLNSFAKTHNISIFDQTRLIEEGSVGIEAVRKMQPSLFLKPYKSSEKMIIIQNAELLTTEAQNAMLKILEEPPQFVFIFLCTTSEDVFLSTILSRCKVVKLAQKDKEEVEKLDPKILEQQIDILENGTLNQKLALAETLALKKDQLPKWFEEVSMVLREELLKKQENQSTLSKLQKAFKTLQTTNVNPRVILEHCFLSL